MVSVAQGAICYRCDGGTMARIRRVEEGRKEVGCWVHLATSARSIRSVQYSCLRLARHVVKAGVVMEEAWPDGYGERTSR